MRASARSTNRGGGLQEVGAREDGSTLIEVVISIVLLGMIGLGVLLALAGSIKVATYHRAAATEELVARNFADALTDAAYVPCAAPSDYQTIPGYTPPSGFTVTVTGVQEWTGDAANPTFGAFGSGCQTVPITTGADTGLQQVSYRVTNPNAQFASTRTLTALKYFDGNTTRSDRIPQGTVRCTIGSPGTSGGNESDATIDQAQPATNLGASPTLNATQAIGKSPAQAQATLLKFNIVAGTTPCIGANDNVSTLPALSSNLVVERAQLTLYNWRITGSPSCPLQCHLRLDRPAADWNENTVTWATAPAVNTGRVLFNLNQGTGSYSPAFQQITSSGLTADVQSFYGSAASPALPNYGWELNEACPPSDPTSTGCATQAPGFQFRSKEWKQASQRPTLEIVLTPRVTAAVQLRNIGSGLCASVKNDDGNDNGTSVIALSCNGKGYQGWINTTSNFQFKSLATVNNGGTRCLDDQPTRVSPRIAVIVYDCTPTATQQQIHVVGSAIQSQQTVNGVATTQCLEVDRGVSGANSDVYPLAGSRVIVNDCDGSPAQQWTVEPQQGAPPPPSAPVRFRDIGGNSCADVEVGHEATTPYWADDYTDSNGTYHAQLTSKMEQYPCMGADAAGNALRTSQTWRFDGYDRIVNARDPSACLNANDGNVATIVTLDYCSNLAQEQWSIETTASGQYRIHSVLTGNCLEGGYDAAQMQVRPCSSTDQRQLWAIESPSAPATAAIGWMRNQGNFNSCMEPQNGAAPAHQVAIWTWPCTSDHPQQEFIRFRVSATQVQYRPTANTTLCLDDYQGGDGTQLHLYNCSVQDPTQASMASTTQEWTLQPNVDFTVAPPPVDTTARAISAGDSGRCEQATTDGTNFPVVLHTCDPNNQYQLWIFEPMGIVHQQNVQYRSALRADSGCLAPETKLVSDTGATFDGNGGDQMTTWPCSGAAQPAESFVRLTDGQIRFGPDVTYCLDSRTNAPTTPATSAYIHTPCGLQYQETWKYVQVTGSNPTRQLIENQTYNICLQAGLDTQNVIIATCDPTNLGQNWYIEPFGTTINTKIGHLRDVDSSNCLEPDGAVGGGRSLWAWPCAGDTRPQQRFVSLNNGEIRPMANPAYCLDDSGSITTDRNAHLNMNACNSIGAAAPTHTPSVQQTWGVDVSGVRDAVIPTGTTAQGFPGGYLRDNRMASSAANSCIREIPGPIIFAGTPATLSGLAIPNNAAYKVGSYAFTRPDCTVAPVGNLNFTFEPTTTLVVTQKQIRLGYRSDSGCIEPSAPTNNNSQFWTFPCSPSRTTEQFALQYDASGNMQIINPKNGFCMDGNTPAHDQIPYFNNCTSDVNQRWTAVPVPNNAPFVELRDVKLSTSDKNPDGSGKAECLQGGLDTANLVTEPCDLTFANTQQWFTIENVGATVNANYVQLQNQQTGWCITPANGSLSNGSSLISRACDQSTRNKFLVTNDGQLHPAEDTTYCIDYHHSNEGNTYLVFWQCHNQSDLVANKSQGWTLLPNTPVTSPPLGRFLNFWDATKCVQETDTDGSPFSVKACVADNAVTAPWQRWYFVPVAGP